MEEVSHASIDQHCHLGLSKVRLGQASHGAALTTRKWAVHGWTLQVNRQSCVI